MDRIGNLIFKRAVSREDPKIKKQHFCMSANRFHNSWQSFEKTYKIKFPLASMKSLTNHNNENPFINLLQEAYSGFPIAAYDTKS